MLFSFIDSIYTAEVVLSLLGISVFTNNSWGSPKTDRKDKAAESLKASNTYTIYIRIYVSSGIKLKRIRSIFFSTFPCNFVCFFSTDYSGVSLQIIEEWVRVFKSPTKSTVKMQYCQTWKCHDNTLEHVISKNNSKF